MEERKNLIQWIRTHKKQLIIAGISIGTLILIIYGIKKRAAIKLFVESLISLVETPPVLKTEEIVATAAEIVPASTSEIVSSVTSESEVIPFAVSMHIRNLPDGCHASPEKIAEALMNGIDLADGQTLVSGYMKGVCAA